MRHKATQKKRFSTIAISAESGSELLDFVNSTHKKTGITKARITEDLIRYAISRLTENDFFCIGNCENKHEIANVASGAKA